MDVPRRLGRYEIIQELGRGGMATVYLARDPILGRELALKVLVPHAARDDTSVRRFYQEARLVAELDHPNIVHTYEVGEEDDCIYIAMEHLPGRSLQQILDEGPLPLETAISILAQVADALDYAHKHGILHRDVKPSNIIVEEKREGYLKATLTDFGLARFIEERYESSRLTHTGTIVGTLLYMAPEQFDSMGSVTPYIDLYALGVVAYEMLTGDVPYLGSPFELMRQHLESQPRLPTTIRPDLPVATDDVLLKAMAKKSTDRFPSAAAFVDALAEAAGKDIRLATAEPVVEGGGVIDTKASETHGETFFTYLSDSLAALLSGAVSVVVAGGVAILSGTRAVLTRVSQSSLSLPEKVTEAAPQPKPMPAVPPSIVKKQSPSLILRPHLLKLLDPVRENTIRELLSQQEPERWIDYITLYGRGRIIITGYGSFGGTTLTKEIVKSVNQELAKTPGGESLLAVRFDLVESAEKESIFRASVQEAEQDVFVERFTTLDRDEMPGVYRVKTLLDVLDDFVSGKPGKSALRKAVERTVGARTVSSRLALIVDKAPDLRTLDVFINHSLFERPNVSYLVIVERERYDHWDERAKKALKRRRKFQVWNVPCLWEPRHRLVERTMDLLFKGYRVDSPGVEEMRHAFNKHVQGVRHFRA